MVQLLGKFRLELNLFLSPAKLVKEILEHLVVLEITDQLVAMEMLVIQALMEMPGPAAQAEMVAQAEMPAQAAIRGILEIPATAVAEVVVVPDHRLDISPVVSHSM
jgi:hypothetical protein